MKDIHEHHHLINPNTHAAGQRGHQQGVTLDPEKAARSCCGRS